MRDYMDFIKDIDWSSPDEVSNGKRHFSVRCRLPFSVPTVGQFSCRKKEADRVIDDSGEGVKLEDDQTGDRGDDDEVAWDEISVDGVASSTSVDFYRTEMSVAALSLMRDQFEGGVPYLPRHSRGFDGIEWDEVIGMTYAAEVRAVKREELAAPHPDLVDYYVLDVHTKLYADEPVAQALVRRLDRGQPIGQSIGGWFTELDVVQNEDGDIERVIVLGVELDHLAVTRAPANPDSNGLVTLRSSLERSAADHRAVTLSKHLASGAKLVVTRSVADALSRFVEGSNDMDVRHVISTMETDGTVVYQYLKAGTSPDDVSDDELVGERMSATSTEGDSGDDGEGEAEEESRSVLPFADLPIAPEDTVWEWDAAAQDAVLGEDEDYERYAKVHAYRDSDMDADTKSAYKLPIGKDFDGTLKAVWAAVQAAMGALNGARGGVDIPDDEREGVYGLLSKYYDKFDKEPPELRPRSEGEDEEEGGSLDSEVRTAHDTEQTVTSVADAQRSALSDDDTFTNADNRQSEEPAMPDALTLDAIRDLFQAELAPLKERVATLEGTEERTEDATNTNQPDAVKALEERAIAAERALANALSSGGLRVGRSAVSPNLPTGQSGRTGLKGLVSAARSKAPTLAAVAERTVETLTGDAKKVSHADLEGNLRDALMAAEYDGLITPPTQRASWQ